MLESHCTLEHSRVFLWGPFSAKLSFNASSDEGQIEPAQILQALFDESNPVLPSDLFSLNSLTNIRGRPAEAFSKEHADTLNEGEEELVLITGQFQHPPEVEPEKSGKEETEGSTQPTPFNIRITTNFEDFPTPSTIRHHLNWQYVGPMEKEIRVLPVSSFLKLFPVEISEVRLGFEYFRGKFIGQWFGISPDITKRLYIEMSKVHFKMTLQEERLASKKSLPFAENNLTETILKVLKTHGLCCSMKVIS